MKKLLTLIFILATSNLYSQWYYTTGHINDMSFVGTSLGYQCGASGVIRKTLDGGEHWVLLNPSAYNDLNAIFFTSPADGFAVGDNQTLIKTTNGGDNWDTVHYSSNSWTDAVDVFFPTSSTGYIVEDNGNFYKTTDAGSTWHKVQTSGFPWTTTSSKLFFTDSITGFAANNTDGLLSTTNGGLSWTNLYQNVDGVTFANSLNGFAYGTYNYYYTSNGGSSWTSSPATYHFSDANFYDAQNGIAVDTDGLTFQTTDGGHTWNLLNSGTNSYLNSVRMLSLNNIVAAGDNATIISSSNGGTNWSVISEAYEVYDNKYPYRSINFADDSTIYAVGSSTSAGDYLIRSTNAGCTWQKVNFPAVAYGIAGSQFFNPQEGFVAGYNHFLKTTDGGANWSDVTVGATNITITNLHMINSTRGILIGTWGLIMKTTNGGTSWDTVDAHVSYSLNDICFVDANTGYIAGNSGVLLKTSDGGDSWINLAQPNNDNTSVYFVNADTGYVGDINGRIYQTTDGGNNWNLIHTASCTCEISDLHFIDASNGFLSGDDSFYYDAEYTHDGGSTWQDAQCQASQLSFNGVSSNNDASHAAYAATEGMVLIYAGQGSALTTSINKKEIVSKDYFSIYPNPARESIQIKYSNQAVNSGEVQIFDLTGKNVFSKSCFSLNDESISLPLLSKGIYFVRLITKDFSSGQKIIIE
jgi:photosystem II stability/assembly factor-like uncharacterized protein